MTDQKPTVTFVPTSGETTTRDTRDLKDGGGGFKEGHGERRELRSCTTSLPGNVGESNKTHPSRVSYWRLGDSRTRVEWDPV